MAIFEYIGKKPLWRDTVAGTNIEWIGNGDIQEVPDRAVPMLLRHPGILRLVDDSPSSIKDEKKQETVTPKTTEEIPLANLSHMDAEALRSYAQKYFGHIFHHKTGEQKMRETLVGMLNKQSNG